MKQNQLATRTLASNTVFNPAMKSLMALTILGAFCATADAQDSLPITVSGFGTGAVTRTDTNDAEFSRLNQASGAAKHWRTGVDSNLGLQVTGKLSETISFTAQGLVRKYGEEDSYGAELTWAFAKFKINDDFSVRLGRVGLPVYMISDVRNVGYANTMLRPPTEVYRQVPFDSADGGDITYQHAFGDSTVTAQFGIGRAKVRLDDGVEVEFKPAMAAQLLLENGPFTYRLGHSRTKLTINDSVNVRTLTNAFTALNMTGILAQIPSRDVTGTFNSAGISMDYRNIIGMAEYAKRKTDTRLVHDTTSWYAMLGYRMGKFLPFVMHGDVKQDSIRSFSTLPTTGPLAPLTAGANGALKAGLQSSTAIGLRWDFYKSAAFKVQMDRVKTRDGVGYLVNPQPGFAGGTVNVYAAAVDFVF
ncbi:hypothetical protein SAMN05428959_103159 [Duganella sp. CF517]|nr:hypothetical protein SAMN05428959_103159 [Duganella sp. CF517]